MKQTVLFVDDSITVLEMARDLFCSHGIEILTAGEAREALAIIRHQDIAVVVSDNCMPGISGVEFLTCLKEISPDTVKILMTGNADLASMLEAINKSEVFRFVLKPWQEDVLLAAVMDGMHRHTLLQSIQTEQEDVLRSLAQAIELKDSYTRGHCDRVAVFALMIADSLQLPKEIKRQIRYGSWLHDCGKIGIAESILNGAHRLSDEEFTLMKMHPIWGADLAEKANLSPVARNVIHFHHERYDGAGYPTGLCGEGIPLEARIVAVADVYDALISDRPYRPKHTEKETFDILQTMQGSALDPHLVDLFLTMVAAAALPPEESNPK